MATEHPTPEVSVDDRLRLALRDGDVMLRVQLDRRTAHALAAALTEFAGTAHRAPLAPKLRAEVQ